MGDGEAWLGPDRDLMGIAEMEGKHILLKRTSCEASPVHKQVRQQIMRSYC